jgi:hypothetical protein
MSLGKLIGMAGAVGGSSASLPLIIGGGLALSTMVTTAGVYVHSAWNNTKTELKNQGAMACIQTVNEASLKAAERETKRLSELLLSEQARNTELSNTVKGIRDESASMHRKITEGMAKSNGSCGPATVPNSVIDLVNTPLR